LSSFSRVLRANNVKSYPACDISPPNVEPITPAPNIKIRDWLVFIYIRVNLYQTKVKPTSRGKEIKSDEGIKTGIESLKNRIK